MLVQDIIAIKEGRIITSDGRTVDQIYKGFQIYKSGKAPAEFTAIKETKQYEGLLDDVKRQIDKYWEKKDAEEVLKKKTRDDKVPLEEVSKTVRELYNEYGAVLTPDKVIIKFIRKYGLTSSDIDRLMPSIKLALRMLPKVKDEVLKKKTEDDESIRGKDGYILRVYKSGSGYNWEVYDPEGQKTKTGLSAGSVQHAKESADQKLGMKIFVDSKPTTDALDPEEKVKQYISSIHNPSKRKYAEEYFHYEQGRSQQPKRPSDLSAMGAQAVEMRIQQLLEGGVSDQAPVSRQSAVKMNVGGKKCPCGGQFVQSSVEELSGGRKKRTEKCDKCGRSQIIITDRKTVTDALDPDETHDIRDIEKEAKANDYFRKVVFTAERMQLVVMCLKPGEDIGEEVHPTTDQFFRIEEGEGKAIVDGREINIKDGSSILIKSGRVHNIINDSNKPLKLYSLYSPPQHQDGLIQKEK